jgi:hypothetical protein
MYSTFNRIYSYDNIRNARLAATEDLETTGRGHCDQANITGLDVCNYAFSRRHECPHGLSIVTFPWFWTSLELLPSE